MGPTYKRSDVFPLNLKSWPHPSKDVSDERELRICQRDRGINPLLYCQSQLFGNIGHTRTLQVSVFKILFYFIFLNLQMLFSLPA